MSVMILVFFISLCRSQEILIQENPDFTLCVENIILYNFKRGSEVTYVDLNYPDNEVIKNIHKMNTVSLVSRTTRKRMNQHNEAYIIMVKNFDTFRDNFENLTKEKNWNPNVHFLIIFKEIDTNLLTNLFNILLYYHVFEVIVLNSIEVELFTYNPFDNYNCGKSYSDIIKLGDCAANISNLYFYKFHTGLKRCHFNAVASNWPPYVINPETNFGPVKLLGTEQYVMKILSELEGFNVNYTYKNNAEEFSVIDNNMNAIGSLSLIQNKNIDMVFGGMLLTYERAEAFSYFCGHHAFTDKLNIVVKKTGPVSVWRNLYLEFTYIVWILLALTFVTFLAVLVLSFGIKEKSRIILIMWAILLQQGCRLYYKFKVKCFIFQWVLFAFLINIYYQSYLMGLTTHVSRIYQVSNEKDLGQFNLQSCVSTVIKELITITTGKEYESGKNCDTIFNSLDTVSTDNRKYTVTLYSIFNYNKFKFTDDFGDSLLYTFKVPIYKIIYAVYFYKGFPMLQKLHIHTLRLRENGLIKHKMDDLFYENARRTFFAKKQFRARFIFPKDILIVGLGLSAICFVIELIVDYVQRRRMNRVIFLH